MSPWLCSCRDARRIASFHNINRSSVPLPIYAKTELTYRASGLVLRPKSVVHRRPERTLTKRKADCQRHGSVQPSGILPCNLATLISRSWSTSPRTPSARTVTPPSRCKDGGWGGSSRRQRKSPYAFAGQPHVIPPPAKHPHF